MKNLQNRKHQIAIIFLAKLVTILCVVGSLFVAYECINRYSKGSTTLIVTRLKTSELEIKFPEFTICSAVSYKMGLLKNYNLTSKEEYLNNGIELLVLYTWRAANSIISSSVQSISSFNICHFACSNIRFILTWSFWGPVLGENWLDPDVNVPLFPLWWWCM